MKSLRRLFSSEKDHTEPPTSAPARTLKEEDIQGYRLKGFHPVSIGDTFKEGRYQVIRKLVFGQYSTVWLSRDSLYIHLLSARTEKGHISMLH